MEPPASSDTLHDPTFAHTIVQFLLALEMKQSHATAIEWLFDVVSLSIEMRMLLC